MSRDDTKLPPDGHAPHPPAPYSADPRHAQSPDRSERFRKAAETVDNLNSAYDAISSFGGSAETPPDTGEGLRSALEFGGNALNPIAVANVGLNVANLAVGIYTAYQVRRIRSELGEFRSEVDSRLASLGTGLAAQARTLEILAGTQMQMSDRMNALRNEMRIGFGRVLVEIIEQQAIRRREKFGELSGLLKDDYEWFARLLASEAPQSDLLEQGRQVDQRAQALDIWARQQLEDLERGTPQRLPLLVAIAFSTRARADFLELRDNGAGGLRHEEAERRLEALEVLLLAEAADLTDGKSLWTLGVELSEVIGLYGAVLEGVRRGRILLHRGEPGLLPTITDFEWDDGLEHLRQAVDSGGESETLLPFDHELPLRTIADYEWFIELTGGDRLTFDVGSRKSVTVFEIMLRLGHPDPLATKVPSSAIDSLKNLALPKQRSSYADRLQARFRWPSPPALGAPLSPEEWFELLEESDDPKPPSSAPDLPGLRPFSVTFEVDEIRMVVEVEPGRTPGAALTLAGAPTLLAGRVRVSPPALASSSQGPDGTRILLTRFPASKHLTKGEWLTVELLNPSTARITGTRIRGRALEAPVKWGGG